MKDYQKTAVEFYHNHRSGVITTGLLALSHVVYGHGLLSFIGSVVLSFVAVHFYSQSSNNTVINVTPKK